MAVQRIKNKICRLTSRVDIIEIGKLHRINMFTIKELKVLSSSFGLQVNIPRKTEMIELILEKYYENNIT